MSQEHAQAALAKHKENLLALKGVNLVYTATKITNGQDTGIPAVVVAVTTKHPREALTVLGLEPVPALLEVENGSQVPTDVVEGGPFPIPIPDNPTLLASPIDNPADHQKRYRPVPGGVSAIVCGSSACTTTAFVWANKRPDGSAGAMLLHNWHCSYLSACADMLTLNPSPYDGGKNPADAISKVTAGNIDNPTTDSAVDVPLNDSYATMDIYGLGSYLGYAVPKVGDALEKSGRTTGLTKGTCTAIDGVANVQYPDKVRTKSDLIVTTDMLAGGDSSSPLRILGVDGKPTPPLAGQGFAGGGGVSLFIKIPNILVDPAIAPFQLDFNHKLGDTTLPPPPPPPPPPSTQKYVALALIEQNTDGTWKVDQVYAKLPIRSTQVNVIGLP